MKLFNLFPTTVGIFDLNRELTVEEKQFLFNLPTRPNMIKKTSIDTYLLNSEILNSLKVFFNASLKEYFKATYDPVTDCSLNITQCWANYSGNMEGHHLHHHSNSIVSGVFYVHTSNLDQLKFYKPFLHHKQFVIQPKICNYTTSDSWYLPARQGSLILFPSHLEHSVESSPRKDTRISLSFNTFLSGVVGSGELLNELILP